LIQHSGKHDIVMEAYLDTKKKLQSTIL